MTSISAEGQSNLRQTMEHEGAKVQYFFFYSCFPGISFLMLSLIVEIQNKRQRPAFSIRIFRQRKFLSTFVQLQPLESWLGGRRLTSLMTSGVREIIILIFPLQSRTYAVISKQSIRGTLELSISSAEVKVLLIFELTEFLIFPAVFCMLYFCSVQYPLWSSHWKWFTR